MLGSTPGRLCGTDRRSASRSRDRRSPRCRGAPLPGRSRVRSSSEMSAPVGLHGELMMMPRVRGVIASRIGPRANREAVLGARADEYRRRFGQLDLLGQRRPVRRVGDDLVAGVEQRERRVEQRLLAAGADDDLVLVVLDAVVEPVAIADRAPQLRDPADRRVFREIAVDRRVRGRVDRARRAKSGSPAPKSITSTPSRRSRSTVAVTFIVGECAMRRACDRRRRCARSWLCAGRLCRAAAPRPCRARGRGPGRRARRLP